jgi:SAM-dependent methyltransferase
MSFEQLKARHSVVWGTGDYERVSTTLGDMHDDIVERLDPGSGERWLDVATGTGEVAKRLARRNAEVTGLDLAPALIETARREAADEGLTISYDVGDAEGLLYPEASFDGVVSTCGVMFAPDHAAVARELARVCKPGGRLGLANWRPESTIGDMFRAMAPFQPPPPVPGAGNPFDWGREEHVEELLGAAFELDLEEEISWLELDSAEAAWELFVRSYGPTRTLAESLEDERREELRRAFVDVHRQYENASGLSMPRTYLRVLGTRR